MTDTRTTRVRAYAGDRYVESGFTAAISLHSHTHYSKEVLLDLPSYIARIPVVEPLFRRELRKYIDRTGVPADFSLGWWIPPLPPAEVLDSETGQIRDVLGLRPIVSITDHDDIRAGLELQAVHGESLPLSVEWTMPFDNGIFHVGVHNMPARRAQELLVRMTAYAAKPAARHLLDLLDDLNTLHETLIVLNHPLWDLARLGPADHLALLRRFLAVHRDRVHALELNGYRTWRENSDVRAIAEASGLCAISGGDRHGCAPNAMLNLTDAASFAEFVEEIRVGGVSDIAVMPAYSHCLASRRMAGAADVLRRRPNDPLERWTDRIWYDWEGETHPLRDRWPDGAPLWIRTSLGLLQLLTHPRVMPLVRWCLPRDTPAFGQEVLPEPAQTTWPEAAPSESRAGV